MSKLLHHYEVIIANAALTTDHRNDLKMYRGFTDEAINALKFRSCGPHLAEEDWFKELPQVLQNSLCKNNVLIPYLNKAGRVTLVRPHKFGIKGEPMQVYCPWQVMPENKHPVLIIAESEFKAVASNLMGQVSIGIPGIKSFSRKKLGELIEVINSFNPAAIVICFDNEIKDNPEFKNYKADFTKRYDTQLYAYLMAKTIEGSMKEDKIPVMVATIPMEWAIDGKADIDGCLAQGMTPAQWAEVIATNSRTPKDYRKSWDVPPKHLSFIERSIDKFFYNGKISEEFNCYYYRKSDSDDPSKGKKIKISNFIIRIIHSVHGDNGATRLIIFQSNYGSSRPIILTPDMMASKSVFTKFCYEHGDYTFTGPESAMGELWEYLFMDQSGKIIQQMDYFGYNKDYNMWIFGNGIYKEGNFYPTNDSNIVSIGEDGFSILDVGASTEVVPPVLSDVPTEFGLMELEGHLANVLDKFTARQFIAWCIGNIFMPEIISLYGAYPFLFLYGTMGSGKSSLAELAMSFFGLGDSKGIPMGASSLVGISRSASRVSMLPMWLEEFRNNVDNKVSKINYLRSIYDKSTIVKGTKTAGEIMTYKARASVVLSGEEYPTDAALVSRCMLLNVNKDKHETAANKKSFAWLKLNKNKISYFIHSIILRRDEWWDKIRYQIDEYLLDFKRESRISERNKLHHSIIAGIADTFLTEDKGYANNVLENSHDMESKVEDNQALTVFWDDILTIVSENKIKQKFYSVIKPAGSDAIQVAINMGGLYGVWEQVYQNLRKELPITRQALLEHIKKEPYYYKTETSLIYGERRSAVFLKWDHPKLPDNIKQIIMHFENEDVSSPLYDKHLTIGENAHGL